MSRAAVSLSAEAPPPRPDHRPVPQDAPHAFFRVPLPEDAPELRAWREHFHRTRTAYSGRNVHGRVMLYTHRLRLVEGRLRWCCS